jgi:hypothetical protein
MYEVELIFLSSRALHSGKIARLAGYLPTALHAFASFASAPFPGLRCGE